MYPTEADWNKHMSEYWRITQAWETALDVLDQIVADVAIWNSILTEEIELESEVFTYL
jgi:hypothetical protein